MCQKCNQWLRCIYPSVNRLWNVIMLTPTSRGNQKTTSSWPCYFMNLFEYLSVMSCSDFCAGFVMDNHLNRHTYGFIQSRLVPFYLHLGSACAFFNLTIYAVYHPSDMLDDREAFQVCNLFHITILQKCLLLRLILEYFFNLRFYFPSSRSSSSLCQWQSQLSTLSGLVRWRQRSWRTCTWLSRRADWVRISACHRTGKLMPSCVTRMSSTDTSAVVCGCTDCCPLCVTSAA